MTTVYVITAGVYSDKHIVRIFSDETLANQFVQQENQRADCWDQCEIDPWPLDETMPKLVPYVAVELYLNGNVCNQPRVKTEYEDELPGDIFPRKTGGISRSWARFVVQTDDVERAVEVANERRSQLIATNQWPGA